MRQKRTSKQTTNNQKFSRKMIALSGVARSGKDTFCKLLIEILSERGIKARRYSFADELKNDLNSFFKDRMGVSIWSCSPDEKELLRPMLVEYGKYWRIKSNGTHWTSKVLKKIQSDTAEERILPIITDVRYSVYEFDEADWVKKNNGVLIHIERYTNEIFRGDSKYGSDFFYPCPNIQKIFIKPVNDEEFKNDPIIKSIADFKFEWETNNNEVQLKKEIEIFLSNNPKIQKWLT